MRVIEAPIEKRHRETLRQTSRDSTSGLPPQLVRASRAPDTADRALWRGISVWRNREAREERRRAVATPAGVLIFRAAGAAPARAIFELADRAAPRPER